MIKQHNPLYKVVQNDCFFLSSCDADLVESMRQAELCDWALDSTLFTSLCDSLNRFFTQKGLIGSTSGGPSPLGQIAPPPLSMPATSPPTLCCLTQPSPLSYPSQLPLATGEPPLQSPRRSLTPQRPPELQPTTSQPLTPNGTLTLYKMTIYLNSCCHRHAYTYTFYIHAALQTQPLTPRSRPPLKNHPSEEIQDDFDWDSLIE